MVAIFSLLYLQSLRKVTKYLEYPTLPKHIIHIQPWLRVENYSYICGEKRKNMRVITLKVPEGRGATFDYAVYLAAKLYEDAEMTAGEAAQVAGLSKRSFIEVMGKYGVSPFNVLKEDLLSDIANA
jgi:hypothetical protein